MSLLRHRALMNSGGASSWEDLVASLSPRLWLKLNETSGTTAEDSSGNNYDGSYQGIAGTAYNLDQAPIYPNMGACARFGTGYVQVADNVALRLPTQDFAVGLAFKRDGTTGRGNFGKLIWKPTDPVNGVANYLLQCIRSTNKISGRVSFSGTSYFDIGPSATTIADGTAYLVFLRRLVDKVSLWVNGAKEAEATLPSPSTALLTSSNTLDVMGGPASASDPVIGYGDEALLIVGAVSDAVMAELWAARQ